MAACDMCGNDYDEACTVTMNGTTHPFDAFECALHMLAPTCAHCGCRIVGHGVESAGTYYCCVHGAHAAGVQGMEDRTGYSRRATLAAGSAPGELRHPSLGVARCTLG